MLCWVKTTEKIGSREVVSWKAYKEKPPQDVLDALSWQNTTKAEVATPPRKFLILEKERLENKIKNFKETLEDVERLLEQGEDDG